MGTQSAAEQFRQFTGLAKDDEGNPSIPATELEPTGVEETDETQRALDLQPEEDDDA